MKLRRLAKLLGAAAVIGGGYKIVTKLRSDRECGRSTFQGWNQKWRHGPAGEDNGDNDGATAGTADTADTATGGEKPTNSVSGLCEVVDIESPSEPEPAASA